jgi:hypothetical protein
MTEGPAKSRSLFHFARTRNTLRRWQHGFCRQFRPTEVTRQSLAKCPMRLGSTPGLPPRDRGSSSRPPCSMRLPAEAPWRARPSIADKNKCAGPTISGAGVCLRSARTCKRRPIYRLARFRDCSEDSRNFPRVLSSRPEQARENSGVPTQ